MENDREGRKETEERKTGGKGRGKRGKDRRKGGKKG